METQDFYAKSENFRLRIANKASPNIRNKGIYMLHPYM